MSSPKPAPKFSLHPATLNDIPHLAQISNLAFKTDTHTHLKELTLGSDHADEMAPVLESWMARGPERCQVIKAVVTHSAGGEGGEEVVGWACLGFRGFQEQGVSPPSKDEQGEEKTSTTKEDDAKKTQDDDPAPSPSLPKITQLSHLTSTTMSHYSTLLTPLPTTKCLILVAITILPSYQGLGIGSSLISYGTKIADERGVFTWVSSSDGGYKAFEKQGFKEIGRLDLDLDDFAEEGVRNEMAEDGKWGRYVWRWMKRDVRGK